VGQVGVAIVAVVFGHLLASESNLQSIKTLFFFIGIFVFDE
jgi:4-hydroxybenzoate polyprenyltransferase